MHKSYSTLIALMITIMLVTACGATEETPSVGFDASEYVLSKFSILDAFKANSKLTWIAKDNKSTIGTLTVDLVAPYPETLDKKYLVQYLTSSVIAINTEGKVSIEKLNIRVKDTAQNTLFEANCFGAGQSYACHDLSLGETTPIQVVTLAPSQPYPIQPFVPLITPTPYP